MKIQIREKFVCYYLFTMCGPCSFFMQIQGSILFIYFILFLPKGFFNISFSSVSQWWIISAVIF